MKRLFTCALVVAMVGCSASSSEAPDSTGTPTGGTPRPADAGSSSPTDAGSTADRYVPPVVQDAGSTPSPDAGTGGGGNVPFPDAGTGGGGNIPFPDASSPFPTGDGGSSNPVCAAFPIQCCTSLTDPACLNLQIILLSQVCCTP